MGVEWRPWYGVGMVACGVPGHARLRYGADTLSQLEPSERLPVPEGLFFLPTTTAVC